ncbi:Uncharacterized protein Nst1_264 [Candidatus Nanobsidianus stetteri]|uniref:DUF2341 domain-containing protein n=1 Tax=Nanobsidianus stetteri TaxID=1294122 RepID=R1G9M9_NANST|nr:Uncharacterized protein Nst1_264 [Candidatus Nanobsidianus stetteri]
MKLLKIFIFGLMVILISRFVYSQGWYQVTITNSQSQATPQPFQQDIAICNGSINIGPNFAYVNNPTLFNEIDSNGQNVYFSTNLGSSPNIYSWYEGQLNYGNTYCDVWWINLPQGINANSEITIYMYIGSSSDNYYFQYYPYVGASTPVVSEYVKDYDNGQDVFIAYGYFDYTLDGWNVGVYSGSWSPTPSSCGVEMLNASNNEGTYILPPNDGNIPKIPLIVEEAWYYTGFGHANVIALFGTNQQIQAASIGDTSGGYTPTSDSSTFVQFQYAPTSKPPNSQAVMLKSAVTGQYLNYTYFPYLYVSEGGTIYSYLIVTSNYAEAGYYIYSDIEGWITWAPITLLDTYTYNVYNSNNINEGLSAYTYANLNYNPFQYGTLEIGAGDGDGYYTSTQCVQWVVARAYPPNGVMPSISIQPLVSVEYIIVNPPSYSPPPPSSSYICPGTQVSSTVTAYLNNPYNVPATVTFSCSAPSGIYCSFSQNSCTTSGSSCSTTLYVNLSPLISQGQYSVTVTASTEESLSSATLAINVGQCSAPVTSVQVSPPSSSYICPGTQTSSTVTAYLNKPSSASTTVTFSCSAPTGSGITCSVNPSSCTTTGSSCSTTLYVSSSSSTPQGSYPINVIASIPGSSSQSTYTLDVGPILIYSLSTSNIQNSYTGCVYYGIIQLQASIQPINTNNTYGPIGNNLEFSLGYPEYILTLNITNIGNIALNNITINLLQEGNVLEILYNGIPIQSLNNINIDQLQPNQSYILQFNVLPLYIGSSSLLLSFNVNGQNIGNAQYNLIVNGPSNSSSLIASENINYILILLGIIGSIIFLI